MSHDKNLILRTAAIRLIRMRGAASGLFVMDDRERFAKNALFCRKRAASLKDPASVRHWTRLAEEYERLAVNPVAAPSGRRHARSRDQQASDAQTPNGE